MTGVKIEPVQLIDVSRWQPNINWGCMKKKGVIWAAMRATVSNYYTDPTFVTNAIGSNVEGIIRVPYHVPRADAIIEGRSNSPVRQMDFFGSIIDGYHDGTVILDVELATKYGDTSVLLPKSQITEATLECWDIAKQRYDNVLWYSRASFMDAYMEKAPDFAALDLFLAEYGLDDGLWYGCHLVPKGCSYDQIVIHQFTGKGPAFCCDPIVNVLDYDIVINENRFKEIFEIQTDNGDDDSSELEIRVEHLEEQMTQIKDLINALKNTVNDFS